jgi:hypothetical protein
MTARTTARGKPRLHFNQLVRVKVVPYGKNEWGVAGTLDGSRSFINYEVGDLGAAEAEAARLRSRGFASKSARHR